MLLATLTLTLSAFAQSVPTELEAAAECADVAGGWLDCEADPDADVATCACLVPAPSRPAEAYFVRVDRGTTTQSTFDGRILVARDLAREQGYRVRLWIDDRARPDQVLSIYATFVEAWDEAVARGLPVADAAAEAARATLEGTHEVGHLQSVWHDPA